MKKKGFWGAGYWLAGFSALVIMSAGGAQAAPIAAHATYVSGEVSVTPSGAAKAIRVVKGAAFAEGDMIKTSSNGVVEVTFDTGNLIRVDKNSELTIKSLSRNDKGSTFSIFGLSLGRVKSAVGKLATKESKFEYHTKAAIAGVSGTPPFVVEATETATNVDLLGLAGQPGEVYVMGFDPSKKSVALKPMTRTTVNQGDAPLDPFPIDEDRFNFLNRVIPFYLGAAPQDVVMENLQIKTTIAPSLYPADSQTGGERDTQYTTSPGGAPSGGGGGSSTPPTQPVGITITIN